MKQTIAIILTGLFSVQVASCQISFSEKRQRDKAFHEGVALILQEDFEMASVKLTECLYIDSTFAPAYLQRGRIMIEWGAMENAMEDIDKALNYNPFYGEAQFYKGYIFFGTDSTGKDEALFDQAISNGFHDPYAYYFRGLTKVREGSDGMAASDFSEAIEQKADFALAYHERAGVKRRMGDLQGSHFDYRTAIEYQPVFPLAYNNLGSVKILLGDYEGAIADYSLALEQDPELGLALNNRGYAHYFLGDLDAAIADFDAAIALDTAFAEASLNKSSVLARQDEIEPALNLLEKALEENPGSALLYLNRGLIRELILKN